MPGDNLVAPLSKYVPENRRATAVRLRKTESV